MTSIVEQIAAGCFVSCRPVPGCPLRVETRSSRLWPFEETFSGSWRFFYRNVMLAAAEGAKNEPRQRLPAARRAESRSNPPFSRKAKLQAPDGNPAVRRNRLLKNPGSNPVLWSIDFNRVNLAYLGINTHCCLVGDANQIYHDRINPVC